MNKLFICTSFVLSFLVSTLFYSLSYGQENFPPDLEIVGSSGGLTPSSENITLRINASGQGTFTRYVVSGNDDPPIEENNFTLNTTQLNQIFQSIQDNDFFNINSDNINPDIDSGDFASLSVRANGNVHEVTVEGRVINAFENIIEIINNATPGDNDMVFDVSPPSGFSSRDVCEIIGSNLAITSSKKLTKEALLNPSSLSPFDTIIQTTGPANAAHPGTVSSYRMPLKEAVNRGIATLESKGGFFGDQVSINVNNSSNNTTNTLQIDLYLEFWGNNNNANDTNAQRIKKAIENAWNGMNVDVNVNTRVNSSASTAPGTSGYHQIELVSSGISKVLGRGTSFNVNQGVGSGRWNTSMSTSDAEYAHEAGHLLGIEDRYQDYRKQPDGTWKRVKGVNIGETFTSQELANLTGKSQSYLEQPGIQRTTTPNDPNDLMSTLGGNPLPSDINNLASQAGLTVEIRPGDILVNKDGSEQNFAITRSTDMFVPSGESKTLQGLFVACIDLHKGIPSFGRRFDLAPPLDTWSNVDAAMTLLTLLHYVDDQELFCEFDFTSQVAIWRISDNYVSSESTSLLSDAGLNLGTQILDFPRLSNPNSANQNTEEVTPPELGETNSDDDGDGILDDQDACRDSDTSPIVVIDGCNTGVENQLLDDGCTIMDLINICAALEEKNHGQFVRCVASTTNNLKRKKIISGREKGAIQSCAARAR